MVLDELMESWDTSGSAGFALNGFESVDRFDPKRGSSPPNRVEPFVNSEEVYSRIS